ncbi:MAG: TetR/AcrR family transcriptional regulator [Pseudomonadota bacterium]
MSPGFTPIPGDSDDARAVRTRDALASALISLMDGRDYNDISVQHICDRAQVGRSTFYAHFQDKDEMYIRHVVVFARILGEKLGWDRGAYRFPIAQMFEHVQHMRPMIESLRKANKTDFIMKLWQNNLAEVFERRVKEERGAIAAEIPAEILAQQLAGTLITLLTWWLDHHCPHSPTEMEQQWGRLVAALR